MKTKNRFKILTTLASLGLLLTACQSSNESIDAQVSAAKINNADVELETEVNNLTDDISFMVDQTYTNEEFANKLETANGERYLPECAVVTKVITDTSKDIIIDFGEACILRNGNTVSGKILMHYINDKTAMTKSITVSFDNFYNNLRKIEGGHSVLRERSNANGNPQSTNTENLMITWPDGTFASKNGTEIHELIAGSDTHTWGDDVFSITGNWTFTRKDGSLHSVTITTPLRKELTCRFIVSGIETLEKDGQTAILDFGDGTCDDLGTISKDGVTETIHLKK